ncbi:hypothetical protein THERMOS_2202 [Bathymodiolus thermophilus thioautotrophic gill symbiont]|uniref:Uncharacterized protein n=1 Tax=Bathymodiolus thermophilus thioautotrophic gill symbiont TaxID=2360 RepID=A0A8H9CGL8_9GAMM|nr:hypothetical protein THERMOS_2202 [Bathymodiolus thermophilus thioautotrophic gill symbiont]
MGGFFMSDILIHLTFNHFLITIESVDIDIFVNILITIRRV